MTYVVALIPARSGSSLLHKNIRRLLGIPLLVYSIRAAMRATGIDRIIVSTDSEEYAAIAKRAGAEVPFIQPAATAKADSGDWPCIAHALSWMERNEKRIPELIVHLRPTTPFRDPELISDAIKTVTSREHKDWSYIQPTALRSVHEMPESAHKCLQIIGGDLMTLDGVFDLEEANRPRQDYPKTYQANGYVDVLRTDYIRTQGKIHGNRVAPFITPHVTEVDTEEDFELLEYQAYNNPEIVWRLLK